VKIREEGFADESSTDALGRSKQHFEDRCKPDKVAASGWFAVQSA
jgi:hypothetical protein